MSLGWVLVKVSVPKQGGRGRKTQDVMRSRGTKGDRGTSGRESRQSQRDRDRQGGGIEKSQKREMRDRGRSVDRPPQDNVVHHKAVTKGVVTQVCPAFIRPNCTKQEMQPLCALVSPGSLWLVPFLTLNPNKSLDESNRHDDDGKLGSWLGQISGAAKSQNVVQKLVFAPHPHVFCLPF